MDGCALALVLLPIGIVVWYFAQADARKRAYRKYQGALSQLKRDPANPDLREEALHLGREYSRLTRNGRGVALFDEVALSNDISAACAAAAQQKETTKRLIATQPLEARLAKLGELRAKGLIDDAEHAARRQEILREI